MRSLAAEEACGGPGGAATAVVGRLERHEATRLVALLVFAWSGASHLACAGLHVKGELVDAGIPSHSVSKDDVEAMMPLEPLWDLLLPLFGLGVSEVGVPLTLSLSLAEPLLLLMLPHAQGSLREFHDRLLSWHLGGIFAHPMLVAQVVVARLSATAAAPARYAAAQSRHSRTSLSMFRPQAISVNGCAPTASEPACPWALSRGAAALGELVGAYALGALAGSALRRASNVLAPSNGALLRTGGVLIIVAASLTCVALARGLLAIGSDPESYGGHDHNESNQPAEQRPLLRDYQRLDAEPCTVIMNTAQRFTIEAAKALWPAWKELSHVVTIAKDCRWLLAARFLTLLAFTVITGPAPLPPVDLFAHTPLVRGFSVLWFDIIGVLTSAVLLPILLSRPFGLEGKHCLHLSYLIACASCAVAAMASLHGEVSAYALAMGAGFALSVCVAFANSVLPMRMLKEQSVGGQYIPVALGWALLAGGVAQMLGAKLGAFLFEQYSWCGVAFVTGAICVAAWYAAEGQLAMTLAAPETPWRAGDNRRL